MTKTRGQIAQVKLKMLELYSRDPQISDAETARITKVDQHTVAKYKKQLLVLLGEIRARVEEKQQEVHEETVGTWQKVSKILGL